MNSCVASAVLLAGAAMVGLAASTPPRQSLTPDYLQALVEEAIERHPGLRAAEATERAARFGVESVRSWDDPTFRFGGVISSMPRDELAMEGDLLYGLEQNLPLFGRPSARRREAEAGLQSARASSGYQRQLIRLAVLQSAYRLALADGLLRVTDEDLALLERMSAFAREQQLAGRDNTLELLRLENERQRREQQRLTERQQRDFEQASLHRLLGRPLLDPGPELEIPAPAPAIPLTERLFELGLRFEPRLLLLRSEVTLADATADLTRRSRNPEVMIEIEGRQWSRSGDFREGMFGVSVSLPWFNRGKYRADLDRDRARAEARRAETADYELEVRRELFRLWTAIDAARREAELLGDQLIPRSALAVDTALAAWSTGRGQFLDLLEARRLLNDARADRIRALVEQHLMIAELITCCGVGEVDALLMLVDDPPSPPTANPDSNPTSP